jgi:hypothetical protein
MTSFLLRFCELSRRERIALRNRAERLTERFTWDVMSAHYHRAHAEAKSYISPSMTSDISNRRLTEIGVKNEDILPQAKPATGSNN